MPKVGWSIMIAEALGIADSADKILALLAFDVIGLAEGITSNWNGVDSVLDTLITLDIPKLNFFISDIIADSLNTSGLTTFQHDMLHQVEEVIGLDTLLSVIGTYTSSIDESMDFVDSLLKTWVLLIAEQITGVDSVGNNLIVDKIIQDSTSTSDAITAILNIFKTQVDSISITTSLSSILTMNNFINEVISTSCDVTLDGKVWQCWSLSSKAFNPSVYTNYNFNSFAEVEGYYYGAKDDGVYLLEGADDAGVNIRTGVKFEAGNQGTEQKKRYRAAFLGMSGTGRPAMHVTTEEGMDKYYLISDRKAIIGRDVYGKDWTFDIADVDTLEFVELMPVILTR
ncbi:MAG TPA: hypothetical protein ENI76_10910 [Ignavibacteria bacterium]|nr:hypothetical protein [Ignavibacteria bacterium]